MKRLEAMYSQMNPEISPEKLAGSIIERANSSTAPKKRSYRRLGGLAAGLAAVCALAVGVGAANNWNYAEAFARIFGEKAEKLQEYVPENERVIENTFTYADFSVEAAAVSNSGMYLMLRADAKNGMRFEDDFQYAVDIDCDSESYDGYGMRVEAVEKTPESVKILAVLGGELKGGNITVIVSDCTFEKEAVWRVELAPPAVINEITKELNTAIGFPVEVIGSDKKLVQGEDRKVRAKNITVSAIDAEVSGIFEQYSGAIPCKEKMWAETKNGERVSLFSISSRGQVIDEREGYSLVDGSIQISFAEPIDINELSAIVFDDERIEF